MSFAHPLWSPVESTDNPMIFTFLRSNCGFIFAMYPSSVVHTGVKSFGCENKTAHESPIQSWKRIRPSVVCASKSGAVSPIFIVLPRRLSAGILFQTQTQKSIVALQDQLAKFFQIDVATGDDGDDRPFASFLAQGCSDRQRTCTLDDNTCFFSQQSHRISCVLESDNEAAVHDWFHSFPHAREHALTAGTIHE